MITFQRFVLTFLPSLRTSFALKFQPYLISPDALARFAQLVVLGELELTNLCVCRSSSADLRKYLSFLFLFLPLLAHFPGEPSMATSRFVLPPVLPASLPFGDDDPQIINRSHFLSKRRIKTCRHNSCPSLCLNSPWQRTFADFSVPQILPPASAPSPTPHAAHNSYVSPPHASTSPLASYFPLDGRRDDFIYLLLQSVLSGAMRLPILSTEIADPTAVAALPLRNSSSIPNLTLTPVSVAQCSRLVPSSSSSSLSARALSSPSLPTLCTNVSLSPACPLHPPRRATG